MTIMSTGLAGEVITLISAIHMHTWMLVNSEFALGLLLVHPCVRSGLSLK